MCLLPLLALISSGRRPLACLITQDDCSILPRVMRHSCKNRPCHLAAKIQQKFAAQVRRLFARRDVSFSKGFDSVRYVVVIACTPLGVTLRDSGNP